MHKKYVETFDIGNFMKFLEEYLTHTIVLNMENYLAAYPLRGNFLKTFLIFVLPKIDKILFYEIGLSHLGT